MPESAVVKSHTPRIALIEPNEADAYWFNMVLPDAQVSAEVVRYPSGIAALREWTERGGCQYDIIIVSDVLPMLSIDSFLQSTHSLNRHGRVVLVGEKTGFTWPGTVGLERYFK